MLPLDDTGLPAPEPAWILIWLMVALAVVAAVAGIGIAVYLFTQARRIRRG